MDEVKKRTEELPKIFGPRPPSSDDDFRADPELHHLFATLPISRTKSNKDVLDELDKAIKSKPKVMQLLPAPHRS